MIFTTETKTLSRKLAQEISDSQTDLGGKSVTDLRDVLCGQAYYDTHWNPISAYGRKNRYENLDTLSKFIVDTLLDDANENTEWMYNHICYAIKALQQVQQVLKEEIE